MESSKTAWGMPMMSTFTIAALVSLLVSSVGAVTGCASTPVPADKLARSQALVETAEQVHAEADPRAAVHLQLAKDQLKSARDLMRDGDNRSAVWVLRRAEADAEAALAIAHAQTAKADAQRTIDAVKQAMSMMQSGGHGS